MNQNEKSHPHDNTHDNTTLLKTGNGLDVAYLNHDGRDLLAFVCSGDCTSANHIRYNNDLLCFLITVLLLGESNYYLVCKYLDGNEAFGCFFFLGFPQPLNRQARRQFSSTATCITTYLTYLMMPSHDFCFGAHWTLDTGRIA